MHTDDPLTWDYVARRELEMESQPGGEPPVTKQAKAEEVGRREERCCAVYEEAVKTLPTGKPWGEGEITVLMNVRLRLPFPRPKQISGTSGSLQCVCLAFQLVILW